ncbi:MAG TPA: sigma-70 family RNA polymerase sigma factor [Balneolaceae bacterium]|nr:sigma-70 family RNA polymerase sigma factor [Balneolaceae bacterium]
MNWEEFKDETTEDLIEFVKFKEDPDYLEEAKAAFIVLTKRFENDLLEKCTVICRNWGYSDVDAFEIAERAFKKFWQTHSFDIEKSNVSDVDLAFKIYLYRIAENELKQAYSDKDYPYDGSEQIITSFDDLDTGSSSEKLSELRKAMDIIDKAMKKLTPKHKIIYLTYMIHQEEGRKLPRKLLKELRERLDLTQNTIRVYKSEAIEEVQRTISNG